LVNTGPHGKSRDWSSVFKDMRTPDTIHTEIEQLSEQRTELWQTLGRGYDPSVAADLANLKEQLDSLWEELRITRAQLRFGDRARIIVRARAEERLERAA
jgi:hypothetical protein